VLPEELTGTVKVAPLLKPTNPPLLTFMANAEGAVPSPLL
jgi:hypothetical protein